MRVVSLIAALMVAGFVSAQPIPAPGVGGMNTVLDVNEMSPLQARYLLNTDAVSFPGMIKRRLGLTPTEVWTGGEHSIYSAFSYYDNSPQNKMFWAVEEQDTLRMFCYDSAVFDEVGDTLEAFGGSVYFQTDLDTVLARADYSEAEGFGDGFVIIQGWKTYPIEQPYWNPTVYHDWLYFDENTIHSSAGDIPVILTTKDIEWRANPDTVTYTHRSVPIGIPRPGQLSARVLRYAAEDTLGDILADGSLEYWTAQDTLQYWDTLTTGGTQNHYKNYSTPSVGDSALTLDHIGGTSDTLGIYQTVVVKPLAQYRLTFDLHYDTREVGAIVWDVYSNPGDSLIGIDSTQTTTGDYVEKTLNVTTLKATTSVTIRILMRGEIAGSTRLAHIDNIVFRRGTATPVVNSLNADYVYTYQFGDASHRDGGAEFGDTAYHSAVVSPRGQAVMLYGFLPSPFPLGDTTSTGHQKATHAFLFRRNAAHPDIDVNWEQVVDFWFDGNHVPMVVDSGQNDGWWNSSGLGPRADTIPQPGQMIPNRVDSLTDLTIRYELPNDSVWVRYSFYDPATDMESDMGPITKGLILDSINASPNDKYRPTLWSLGWFREQSTPTNWIRVYRTHNLSEALGDDDSTIWYCEYQFPIQQMSGDQEGTQVILGMVPDTFLTNGVDFSLLDQGYKTYSDSASHLPQPIDSTPFTADNEAYDKNGDFIIRPPVVEQLVLYFSDMEFTNFRLWGIGDALYPSRLYYSNYKGYWDWSASRYLD